MTYTQLNQGRNNSQGNSSDTNPQTQQQQLAKRTLRLVRRVLLFGVWLSAGIMWNSIPALQSLMVSSFLFLISLATLLFNEAPKAPVGDKK